MSWLLENWFGSKESLEQVREDVHNHLQKESYLGVSGIDNPEQSSNRIPSKEMVLNLHGPWGDKLDEQEAELMQYIHDELPPVVRDEVGIFPFFTQVTQEGYLVLTFIRNATSRNMLFQRLPLRLVTPDGKVVARKTFHLLEFGPVGDKSSRPCEFLFPWSEFEELPDKEVPLTLEYKKPEKTAEHPEMLGGELTEEEQQQYQDKAAALPVEDDLVDLQVLDILDGTNNGLKVVVLFRNGLNKRLEFTEVPIIVHDKAGDAVARVHYTLENLKVEAKGSRMWAFEIPATSIKKEGVKAADCTAFIPKAKQQKKGPAAPKTSQPNGLLQ
ncbi:MULTISPECIES: SLAP domain-containing protein [unclassified Brevibacillus]|jgi:SLAP domain-containing protein|uniref:SLAP domain-containing protein n=1 Tax=unclassified Brevibacillus TaxID=2684853 RepID=UPI001491AF9B|nr:MULTISPECIES: SLAP domain-containing protein [unclassified Brevibacillus]MBR8661478.1 SLAP domain-containing protein [Brevibacillus sp. NL20B1]NNV01338.1 SLAP domain-containing protein [Brevibacillus sp. MCWH]